MLFSCSIDSISFNFFFISSFSISFFSFSFLRVWIVSICLLISSAFFFSSLSQLCNSLSNFFLSLAKEEISPWLISLSFSNLLITFSNSSFLSFISCSCSWSKWINLYSSIFCLIFRSFVNFSLSFLIFSNSLRSSLSISLNFFSKLSSFFFKSISCSLFKEYILLFKSCIVLDIWSILSVYCFSLSINICLCSFSKFFIFSLYLSIILSLSKISTLNSSFNLFVSLTKLSFSSIPLSRSFVACSPFSFSSWFIYSSIILFWFWISSSFKNIDFKGYKTLSPKPSSKMEVIWFIFIVVLFS